MCKVTKKKKKIRFTTDIMHPWTSYAYIYFRDYNEAFVPDKNESKTMSKWPKKKKGGREVIPKCSAIYIRNECGTWAVIIDKKLSGLRSGNAEDQPVLYVLSYYIGFKKYTSLPTRNVLYRKKKTQTSTIKINNTTVLNSILDSRLTRT